MEDFNKTFDKISVKYDNVILDVSNFENALFTSSSAIWFSKFTDCRSFKKIS
jgi:hypothetical protein